MCGVKSNSVSEGSTVALGLWSFQSPSLPTARRRDSLFGFAVQRPRYARCVMESAVRPRELLKAGARRRRADAPERDVLQQLLAHGPALLAQPRRHLLERVEGACVRHGLRLLRRFEPGGQRLRALAEAGRRLPRLRRRRRAREVLMQPLEMVERMGEPDEPWPDRAGVGRLERERLEELDGPPQVIGGWRVRDRLPGEAPADRVDGAAGDLENGALAGLEGDRAARVVERRLEAARGGLAAAPC